MDTMILEPKQRMVCKSKYLDSAKKSWIGTSKPPRRSPPCPGEPRPFLRIVNMKPLMRGSKENNAINENADAMIVLNTDLPHHRCSSIVLVAAHYRFGIYHNP